MIEALQRQGREKDELVRKTYEEMKYFKLELQNREENFNGLFGNHPRVGTLNPVGAKGGATKDAKGGATKELSQPARGAISQFGAGGLGGGVGGGASSAMSLGNGAGGGRRQSE